MLRKAIRQIVRKFGYDGMAKDRFDRLTATEHASSQATPTHPRILRDYFSFCVQRHEPVYLLQVGANDAVTHDFAGFMREHPRVLSALVEPQPHCAESLRRLQAANPRIRVLPCAFGEHDSSATLYRFAAEEEGALKLSLFSSFHRALVEQKKDYYRLRAEIVSQPVEACTLRTLLRRAEFPRADILISDIEGHDDALVRQALATLQPLPSILVFEQCWLRREERSRCYQLLHGHGYGIVHGDEDALCFRLREEAGA